MRSARIKFVVGFGIVLLLGLALFASQGPKLLLRYPALIKIVNQLRDPIGPNLPVVWERGPESPSTPPNGRPPNIVVILVDDLGWNDLTWNGGGVANGAVPTPNIDSIAREGVEFTMG